MAEITEQAGDSGVPPDLDEKAKQAAYAMQALVASYYAGLPSDEVESEKDHARRTADEMRSLFPWLDDKTLVLLVSYVAKATAGFATYHPCEAVAAIALTFAQVGDTLGEFIK